MFSSMSGTEIGIFLVVLILSMSTHEAMHAYMGHWLGDSTAHDEGRITLNPLKHIDLLTTVLIPLILVVAGYPPFFAAKPVPFNPARVKYDEYGAALIGAIGPFTNLAIAIVAALLLRIVGGSIGSDFVVTFLLYTLYINVGFFAFNMIPFPPLDGSRVLYAFAPDGLRSVMERIESYGFTAIVLFVFVIYRFIGPYVRFVEDSIIRVLLG